MRIAQAWQTAKWARWKADWQEKPPGRQSDWVTPARSQQTERWAQTRLPDWALISAPSKDGNLNVWDEGETKFQE